MNNEIKYLRLYKEFLDGLLLPESLNKQYEVLIKNQWNIDKIQTDLFLDKAIDIIWSYLSMFIRNGIVLKNVVKASDSERTYRVYLNCKMSDDFINELNDNELWFYEFAIEEVLKEIETYENIDKLEVIKFDNRVYLEIIINQGDE